MQIRLGPHSLTKNLSCSLHPYDGGKGDGGGRGGGVEVVGSVDGEGGGGEGGVKKKRVALIYEYNFSGAMVH